MRGRLHGGWEIKGLLVSMKKRQCPEKERESFYQLPGQQVWKRSHMNSNRAGTSEKAL